MAEGDCILELFYVIHVDIIYRYIAKRSRTILQRDEVVTPHKVRYAQTSS